MDQLQEKFEKGFSNTKDIFLAHMEGKYDVAFLPVSYESSGPVTDETFRCYPEGTDRDRDCVTVYREIENGEDVFYDDYFGILVRDEYEARIRELAEPTAGTVKAFIYSYAASFFSNDLTAENTLDDAIAMGQSLNASKLVFFEVIPGSEAQFEEICDQIADALHEAKLTGSVKFYGLAAGKLENITEDNFLTYLPSLSEADGKLCLMTGSRYVRAQ